MLLCWIVDCLWCEGVGWPIGGLCGTGELRTGLWCAVLGRLSFCSQAWDGPSIFLEISLPANFSQL
jgi:hypothetical protein